ncbi:hypothetical protein F511_38124 [Dorcoceras hygrometricum]|uniref:Uncharacterized protein n=1 Tax=Dorcoceras hygrometricum TaxID=472368 RepID=A0A2Z7BQ89_9LAMI|nr:hypothetical protein F511_38124 [Dorcoceras hygrometricum]
MMTKLLRQESVSVNNVDICDDMKNTELLQLKVKETGLLVLSQLAKKLILGIDYSKLIGSAVNIDDDAHLI